MTWDPYGALTTPPPPPARCYGCNKPAPPAAEKQPAWCADCAAKARDARERDAAR